MQLQLTGHHIEITEAMRNHLEEKMQKISRHFDQVLDCQVILTVEKNIKKAEATLHVHGKHLHAEAHGDDMYAAMDAMVDKLDRQVLKHKEKLKAHS